MDIVVIFNGLGNQMSQYALYLAKLRSGQNVAYLPISNAHNGFELKRLFRVPSPRRLWTAVTRVEYHFFGSKKLPFYRFRLRLSNLCGFTRYDENLNYMYQPGASSLAEGVRFLVGGWHAERYFAVVADELRRLFTFPDVRDAANLSALTRIRAATSISLHVRRGDYNDSVNQQSFGSVCHADYYRRALDVMKARIPSFQLIVFSNDPAWARENIQGENVLYVDWNSGHTSWIDMYLMSQCNHHIICNSTFSWWGAWLNDSSDKIVVCPDRFVAHDSECEVYPLEWIRIGTQHLAVS